MDRLFDDVCRSCQNAACPDWRIGASGSHALASAYPGSASGNCGPMPEGTKGGTRKCLQAQADVPKRSAKESLPGIFGSKKQTPSFTATAAAKKSAAARAPKLPKIKFKVLPKVTRVSWSEKGFEICGLSCQAPPAPSANSEKDDERKKVSINIV